MIREEGFKILLQAQCSEEDIRKLVGIGYDIQKVDIFECKAEEFLQGFNSGGQEEHIDLESSVEEIETRSREKEEGAKEAPKEEAKKQEKPKNAPGDLVIK